MEWLLLFIILAALAVLAYRLLSGGGGGGTGPSPAATTALTGINDLLTLLTEENRGATPAECTNLKAWLTTAQNGGVPSLTWRPLKAAIDALCP